MRSLIVAALVVGFSAVLVAGWAFTSMDVDDSQGTTGAFVFIPGGLGPERTFNNGVGVCKSAGVAQVARELGTNANPADAAEAYADRHGHLDDRSRQAVLEGCLRGFKQRRAEARR